MARAFMSFSRTIPPRYGQSRSRIAGVSHGRRSLVENTQCIRQELNECKVLSSLRDFVGCVDALPSAKALGYFRPAWQARESCAEGQRRELGELLDYYKLEGSQRSWSAA